MLFPSLFSVIVQPLILLLDHNQFTCISGSRVVSVSVDKTQAYSNTNKEYKISVNIVSSRPVLSRYGLNR